MKKKIIALIGGTALALTALLNVSTVIENNTNLDLASLAGLSTANAEINNNSFDGEVKKKCGKKTIVIEKGIKRVFFTNIDDGLDQIRNDGYVVMGDPRPIPLGYDITYGEPVEVDKYKINCDPEAWGFCFSPVPCN